MKKGKSKYDGWRRVFPHPLKRSLVEKEGWPVDFAYFFTDIGGFCRYELTWRDMEAQTAYYRLWGLEKEAAPAAPRV